MTIDISHHFTGFDGMLITGPYPSDKEDAENNGENYAAVNQDGVIAEFFGVIDDLGTQVDARTHAIMFQRSIDFFYTLLNISLDISDRLSEDNERPIALRDGLSEKGFLDMIHSKILDIVGPAVMMIVGMEDMEEEE